MKAVLNGYSGIATGLGTEARWLWKLLPFDTWIQHKHPKLGFASVGDRGNRTIVRTMMAGTPWSRCLRDADVVVAVERLMPQNRMLEYIDRYDIPLVVLANPEWTTRNSPWLSYAKLAISRTELCKRHLNSLGVDTVVRNVPVDLEELPFRQRSAAERVRFSNGWGGVHDRKGWPEVRRMLELKPGRVEVYSQRPIGTGTGETQGPCYLYNGADVMLVPSRFEGVGLGILEAMASGCIVVTTDAEPMSQFVRAAYGEHAELCLLPVAQVQNVDIAGLKWPAHIIDPQAALHVLDKLKRSMIAPTLSAMGRAYIEREHGPAAAEQLWETIKGVV